MTKFLIRVALAAMAIAVVVNVAQPVALAAGTWTVTGGANFTASASAGTTFTLTDSTSGLTITCTSGTLAGTVVDGTSSTNIVVGSITAAALGTCHGPLGTTCTIMKKTGTTGTINVTSFNGGTVTGTITNVDLIITCTTVLGTCTAEAKGTVGFDYKNSSSLLQYTTTGGQLTITSTSGACAGILRVGDVIVLSSGTLGLILTGSPVNPISISQP